MTTKQELLVAIDAVDQADMVAMITGRPYLADGSGLRLIIRRAEAVQYQIFEPHHYLPGHNPAARCYLAELAGEPVAWISVLRAVGGSGWRVHRLCVLPQFQRRGIAGVLVNWMARQVARESLSIRTRNREFVQTLIADGGWRPSRHGRDATSPDRRTGSPGTVASTAVRAKAVTVCTICRVGFPPAKSNAVYCSGACRAKAYRRRKRKQAA